MKWSRLMALAAVFTVGSPALADGGSPNLQPLSTADVDPASVDGPGCYLHEGENILLIGVRRNAVLSLDNDLLLIRRSGSADEVLAEGAGYHGNGVKIHIAVAPDPAQERRSASRIDRPATVTVQRNKAQRTLNARWNCAI